MRASEFSSGSKLEICNGFSLLRLQGAVMPYIVIEEVDEMTKGLHKTLRGLMDQTEKYGKFILTTNNCHLLEDPLVDRCDAIELLAPSVDNVLPKAYSILKAEGIGYDERQLIALLSAGDGSIRRMLRNLEDLILNPRRK